MHISSFLDANAAVWWRHYYTQMKKGLVARPTTWAQMRALMERQFQVFNYETELRDRYYALRQNTSVSAYITKFRALVTEIGDMPQKEAMYHFLKGLKPEIQARTRTQKPVTLEEAMDIADEADRANAHAHRHGGSYKNYSRSNGGGSGPQPMQLGVISPADMQQLR